MGIKDIYIIDLLWGLKEKIQGFFWWHRLRFHASTAAGMSSVPGWATKIPYSAWPKQKKVKERKGENSCKVLSIEKSFQKLFFVYRFLLFCWNKLTPRKRGHRDKQHCKCHYHRPIHTSKLSGYLLPYWWYQLWHWMINVNLLMISYFFWGNLCFFYDSWWLRP